MTKRPQSKGSYRSNKVNNFHAFSVFINFKDFLSNTKHFFKPMIRNQLFKHFHYKKTKQIIHQEIVLVNWL